MGRCYLLIAPSRTLVRTETIVLGSTKYQQSSPRMPLTNASSVHSLREHDVSARCARKTSRGRVRVRLGYDCMATHRNAEAFARLFIRPNCTKLPKPSYWPKSSPHFAFFKLSPRLSCSKRGDARPLLFFGPAPGFRVMVRKD